MPRHPIELARKHYEELPAVLKQALFSTDIAEQMFEIGKKFGLTIEQTGIMAEESGYVMLGLNRPNEFVGNLAGELDVDTDKAQDIAAEINHKIFFPLREELKRTHDFDIGVGEIVGSTDIARVSGVPMPLNLKKILVEERSPLVVDLTRVREQMDKNRESSLPSAPVPKSVLSGPTFQPSTPLTGRIADLNKMSEKPVPPAKTPQQTVPLPVPPTQSEPKPLITQPKEILELKTSIPPTAHPTLSISSGVGAPTGTPAGTVRESVGAAGSAPTPPLDLRPQQKPSSPPPSTMQTKSPPLDLREKARAMAPVVPRPRMTPQLQDLPERLVSSGEAGWSDQEDTDKEEILLTEKMRAEPQKKTSPPQSTMPTSTLSSLPPVANTSADSDPYREPIEE